MKKTYLTEETLGEALKVIFPGEEFVHDKKVPDSNCNMRPDYRCDNLKLIIEFDGDTHYFNVSRCKDDLKKDKIFRDLGYTVIRIPYFVQLSTETIRLLFKKDLEWSQIFPHGFITTKFLPAGMCSLGLRRFKQDLEFFKSIKIDILKSLEKKFEEYGNDWEYVLPIGMELSNL